MVQGNPGNAVEGRYRKFQPLELDPEKQLAEVKAEASRMAREFGTAVTVWRYVTTASVRIPLPEVFFPDDDDEREPEPEPDIDDRATCHTCGAPMSDGEYEDNHGQCSNCLAFEE